MSGNVLKRNALLSAFNKAGLDDFARALIELGFDVYASQDTSPHLVASGVYVQDVAPTDSPGDAAELRRLGIPRFDLVYVDLYPLEEEIAREGATLASVLEKTDIGGPTMLRSAAKDRRIVLCSPDQFAITLKYLRGDFANIDNVDERFISHLVAVAEEMLADYCLASSEFHANIAADVWDEMEAA
ncbi:MAG: hypothetical protein WC030_03705 [Candidatus Paceibacterota bacterium]